MERGIAKAETEGKPRMTGSPRRRIALIHATPVSIAPVRAAFARLWPEAATPNILDDSLSLDQTQADALTPTMIERFERLGDYAVTSGADGILFTCSAFGPAIDRVRERLSIPVLKPNEAMFEAAIAQGGRIVMLVTFAPSAAPLKAEFENAARDKGAVLQTVLVEGALDALSTGDTATHNRLIAAAASEIKDAHALLLAQFSMAQARPLVEISTSVPVLTAPESAVAAMRARFDAPV